MALTNNDASKLAQNIVTDVNANVSSPSAPERVLSREAAILFNKSIVARPLMTPEVCSIRVKNTEYAYRWVNRSSRNGQFYMQRRAQGFINATADDVEILGGDAVADGGEITAGDLILMKIRQDLYDAAIKNNMEKAMVLSRARGMYLEGASHDVMSDNVAKRVSVAQEPFSKTGLAQPFIPGDPDAIVEDSIKSGRVEEARKAVEGLRKQQK